MWKLKVVAVTLLVCISECYARNISRTDGSKQTLATPGYDFASKTIRLQKCFATGEFNASKIPMPLYDLQANPKQTQVHRYYNATRFLYINPVSVSPEGKTFICPNGTAEELFNLRANKQSKQLKRYFLPNGYIRMPEGGRNVTGYIPPTLYCIKSISGTLVKGKACIPKANSTFPRIRRCRKSFPSFIFKITNPRNKSMSILKIDEIPRENVDPWDVYRDSRFPIKDGIVQLPYYFYQDFGCKAPYYVVSDPAVVRTTTLSDLMYLDILVTKQGNLKGRNSRSEQWRPIQSVFKSDDFCIENGFAVSDSGLESSASGNQTLRPEYQRLIMYCRPDVRPWRLISINHWFILVGMLFLLVTLIIYALVWNQQTIHGKVAAGFVSSMFLLFLSQYLNNLSTFQLRSIGCVLNGIFQHFITLTMYTWMAVMNYDVWQALSTVRHASQDKSSKKWILYCLINYGSAGIIVLVSAILHFSYEIDSDRIVHPQYGFWVCYINFSVYNYYILPGSLISFTISVCFSLMTFRTLFKWNKATRKLTKSKDSNSLNNWLLALKVFILTGISWGLDLGYNATHGMSDEVTVWWWLTDVYNFLQAVGLFWILVVKPETRKKLCKNYEMTGRIFDFWDRNVAKVKDTPTTSQHTSSESNASSDPSK